MKNQTIKTKNNNGIGSRPQRTERVDRKPLTEQERKAYAKECTALAKEHDIPFHIVLLFKKDIEKAKHFIDVCSKLVVTPEDQADIEQGGSKRVDAFKRLGIPFKGINVDKIDIFEFVSK